LAEAEIHVSTSKPPYKRKPPSKRPPKEKLGRKEFFNLFSKIFALFRGKHSISVYEVSQRLNIHYYTARRWIRAINLMYQEAMKNGLPTTELDKNVWLIEDITLDRRTERKRA